MLEAQKQASMEASFLGFDLESKHVYLYILMPLSGKLW